MKNERTIVNSFKKIVLTKINKESVTKFRKVYLGNIDDEKNFEIFSYLNEAECEVLLAMVENGEFSLDGLLYENKDYEEEIKLFQNFLNSL